MIFRNFGRELYEEALNKVAREVLLKKKKDLERLMKNESINVIDYVRQVAGRNGRVNKFESYKHALGFAIDYNDTTHYYVDASGEGESLICKDMSKLSELGDTYTIECNIGEELTLLMCYHNLANDSEDLAIYIRDKRALFCISVFVKISDKGVNKVNICIPITLIYGFADNTLNFAYNADHPMTINTKHIRVPFRFGEYKGSVSMIVNPDETVISNMFQANLYCVQRIIEAKSTIKVKKRKAKTSTVSSQVNTVKEASKQVEVVYEDKLVSLQRYIYEYSPSAKTEHKGGTHASPVDHNRRGFYRKSRGRGDYELVNGEFVFVGDMKGSYSWVSATEVHGKGKDKKPVLIYKA